MGTWGVGLYSSDLSEDLKPAIKALSVLPISGDEIVDLLIESEPSFDNVDDSDYTTFWLIVAAQLHRRGIDSRARAKAIAIIDSGADLETWAGLGLQGRGLAKRSDMLDALRRDLVDPPVVKKRRVLTRPQPLLLTAGQVFVMEVDANSEPKNPYDTKGVMDFDPVAWRVGMVLSSGHEFGYLAWYALAIDGRSFAAKPTLDQAIESLKNTYALRRPATAVGTATRPRMQRMGIEIIGMTTPLPHKEPKSDQRRGVCVDDIDISNLIMPIYADHRK